MKPSISRCLPILFLLIFSVISVTNVAANNKNLMECDASFWAFPEGPLAFFDPFNYYDDASYFWDFGDGNTSTEQSPIHEYLPDPDNFVFEVTLTIVRSDGETCTSLEVFIMESAECNSMFVYEVHQDGLTVDFEDQSWGIITAWNWDFGDGNLSNSQHPTHVYEESGEYEVNLSVECLGGEVNDLVLPVSVNYETVNCNADFEYIDEFGFLYFMANYQNGAIYHWDFGDGNTLETEGEFAEHIYEGENGDEINVVVTLTVTLPDGQICTSSQDVNYIIFVECNAMFYYETNDAGPDGFSVYFEDQSWGEIISWNWDFGDGNTSNAQHPTHVYSESGEYVVVLTVECEDGQTSELAMEVYLPDGFECDAQYEVEWAGNDFYFYPFLYTETANYLWDFGDGNTSNEMTPMHTYDADPGSSFLVTLTITLENGETCSYTNDIIIEVIDECTAMFEYNTMSDDGMIIGFFDASWGNIISWEWQFGDGTTSNEQHPIHVYNTAGDYEVLLTIVCANGDASTFVMPIEVGFGGECDAFFWYGQELNQVYFFPNNESPEATYLWDFGDGITSTEINPVHEFEIGPDPSEVVVTLTVTLSDGTSCTYTEFVFLEPLECNPMFSYYPIDDNELEVQFNDESWGIPTSWTWDFGDGTTSTDQNPIHEYQQDGVYNVMLTINCVGGETNTIFMDAHIGDVLYCEAGFWYDFDFTNNTFFFYPFTQMDDAIFNWDFGDGNTSTESNPVHNYDAGPDPFEYLVTLEVTLSDGQTCYHEEYVFIEPVECNAMFEYGPAPNDATVIAFWDTSWGAVVSWFWDFGDGSTSAEQNPTHDFEDDGVHLVTLTITCAGGEQNTITMEVYTNDVVPCEAAFNYYVLDELGVYFESELIYDDAEYFWDFGDGQFSTEMMPTYFYSQPGWYPIFLEIILPNGTACFYEAEILIGDDNPDLPIECEAFFSFNQADDNPMNIQFFNQSFSDNDEVDVQWHFGDGVTSTEFDPQHQYEEPGVYIVTLTIVSGDCIDTFPMQIFIANEAWYPDGCQALFLPVETNSGYIFYDLSNGIVANYLWDFGDGNLSTNATPFHDYAVPGEYEVTLTITTEDGCESTFSITLANTGFMGNGIQAYMVVTSTSEIDFVQDPIVYPNPTDDILNLEFELDQFEAITVNVIAMDGKVINTYDYAFPSGKQIQFINVNELPPAIYIIRIQTGSKKEFYTRFAKL